MARFGAIHQRRAGDLADLMVDDMQRYAKLRQHQDGHEVFKEQLYTLQKWQVARLRTTHENLLVHPEYESATEFVLVDVYGGIDLRDLSRQIEKALPIALRVFPENLMRTSAIALELNAITAEMDEHITETLFEKMRVDHISADAYIEAYQDCDNKELRVRQIQLGQEMAKGIDKYVKSRMIYGAFKLARRPARKYGLISLYDFMGKGFDVLRPMRSTTKFFDMITHPELDIIHRIHKGDVNPFRLPEDHFLHRAGPVKAAS